MSPDSRKRSFTCPTCTEPLAQRFTRSKNRSAPAEVLQCPRCFCVLIDEQTQREIGIDPSLHDLEATETGGRRCPRCEREFKLLNVRAKWALFEKVELDKCPACNALFFDPGELQKALGRVASITATANDEYLNGDPERVSSQMSDPRGPWRGDGPHDNVWLALIDDLDFD